MANFQNNAITENGTRLRSHVDMGAAFTATKIVIGSGNMPTGKTARTMTDVVSPVKVLPINKKERFPDGKVVFGGVYTNEDVAEEFYFRELALYAKAVYPDGTEVDEVLYSYGNAGGNAERMAAYSTSTVVERQMDIVTFIGNEAQVNLTIEPGIAMTKEMLENYAVKKTGDTLSGTYKYKDSTRDGSGARVVAENGFKIVYQEDINSNASARHILSVNPFGEGLNGALRIARIESGGTSAWYDVLHTGNTNLIVPDVIGAVKFEQYTGDMNALIKDGHYRLDSNENLPDSAHHGVAIVCRGSRNQDTVAQIVIGYNNKYIAFRGARLVGGTWSWEPWNQLATTDSAVSKTGDQTMTGSLTMRSLNVTDGYMNGNIVADGVMSRLQILAKSLNNGAAGAILVGPNGIDFMDTNGYEYRVFHEGNAPAVIATAELE